MSYLIIDQNNVVQNWVVWDGVSPYEVPPGCRIMFAPDGGNIGWVWDGTKAVDPNPPATSTSSPQDAGNAQVLK